MDDKTLTLFEDIPTKQTRTSKRREVPDINTTAIPFEELQEKKIVVTGKLFQMRREDFRLWLKAKDAIMQSSVSNNTDLLIVGENPGGAKLTKAEELNIPVCYESDFFEKFGRQLTLGIEY